MSRCLSGRFNHEGLVPHKQYFAGILLGMSSCASYVSRTHDVIDDVTRSQSRSNFESNISPSKFELERRSKAQDVGNANGYLFGIFNFRYNFWWKGLSRAQYGGYFENSDILNTASIWPQILQKLSQIMPKKFFSWQWRHRWRHMVASNFPSIFMFRRGWFREQVASNVSSINANIIIVILGYTCQKTISMNNTFRDCRSKVNITGLVGDLGT